MDSDQGKVFVGGISWETNEETLKDHFKNYGDVIDTVIMRDKATGSARGFGFVQFSDPNASENALQDKHVILGRTVEVKRAVPRGDRHHHHHHHHHNQQQQQQQQDKGLIKNSTSSSNNSSSNQFRTKKIFVGGLSSSLTEEDFRGYFEKFGRITDVVVMYDNVTHRPRGFGFITFDSEEAVESVMEKNFHELNDKLVEVKRAVPKDGNNNNTNHNSGNNSNHNVNSYNTTFGGGRGSVFGSYQGGNYPPYSPRYGFYHGYAPPPVSGYFGGYAGGYGTGGYGGIGYSPPILGPRSPWNGPGMVGARRSPAPYGNNAVYPGYVNGGAVGYVGVGGGGYRGFVGGANGKWSQRSGDVQMASRGVASISTLSQADGGKLDNDSSGFKQNQRGSDGRFRPYNDHIG